MARRIDAHVHFWAPGVSDLSWMAADNALRRDYLPEHLTPHLVKHGIDGVVLIQAGETYRDNRWWLKLAAENDFILGVIGWTDFANPEQHRAWLNEFTSDPKFRGVRLMLVRESDPDWVERANVRESIAELARRDLVLDLLLRTEHLLHVPAMATRHPDLRIVLNHAAAPAAYRGPVDDWKRGIEACAAHPNVYIKVSALISVYAGVHGRWTVEDAVSPYAGFIRRSVGIGRCAWASDWPSTLAGCTYDDAVGLGSAGMGALTAAEEEAFFGGTAARAYRV